jgi:hypothetical protein
MMTTKEVILAELIKILFKAQRRVSDDLLDTSIYKFFMDDGIEIEQSLPPMNLRVQVAMLKGLPVNTYDKLSYHAQQVQRSWHLEILSRCQNTFGCIYFYCISLSARLDIPSTIYFE